MAFIRIERKKSGDYIRIIESYWEEGKPKNRTLYSLGKVQDYTPQMLSRMADKLKEAAGEDLRHIVSSGENQLQELGRFNYGFYLVYYQILRSYGLDRLIRRIEKSHKLGYDLLNALMLMLIERLHDPVSKRSNYFNQQDYLGIEQVELHQLYRSLDWLADSQSAIQLQIYQAYRNLFNQQLDVVFYDVTTFYFESELEREGSLRQKGFSKEGKLGRTQILFGLLLDKDKHPVAYQVFKGDTFEGHTFKKALEILKKRYQIDQIIVVADRGMLSKHNIELTQEKGYEFIMGERLKTLPRVLKEKLLDLTTYNQQWISDAEDPVVVRYKIVRHKGRTIIATYSQQRAEKDCNDRVERLLKAEYLLRHPSQIKNKARRYFLKNQANDQWRLDEERIKNAECYDGFLAITTNAKNVSPQQVLNHYHHLFQIEHSFRTFKSYLETRPMFHWTDKRIEGHLCLCYIAYALLNNLLQRIKKYQITEKQLRMILNKMQVSLIKQAKEQYYLRSKAHDKENTILKLLGISPLPNLIPADKISDYIKKT